MKFQPTGSRVLLRRQVEQQVTASGIIIAGDSKKKIDQGIVVATGPGNVRPDGSIAPVVVKEGDLVVFNIYSATEIAVGRENFLLLNDSDIFGRLVE